GDAHQIATRIIDVADAVRERIGDACDPALRVALEGQPGIAGGMGDAVRLKREHIAIEIGEAAEAVELIDEKRSAVRKREAVEVRILQAGGFLLPELDGAREAADHERLSDLVNGLQCGAG